MRVAEQQEPAVLEGMADLPAVVEREEPEALAVLVNPHLAEAVSLAAPVIPAAVVQAEATRFLARQEQPEAPATTTCPAAAPQVPAVSLDLAAVPD